MDGCKTGICRDVKTLRKKQYIAMDKYLAFKHIIKKTRISNNVFTSLLCSDQRKAQLTNTGFVSRTELCFINTKRDVSLSSGKDNDMDYDYEFIKSTLSSTVFSNFLMLVLMNIINLLTYFQFSYFFGQGKHNMRLGKYTGAFMHPVG